MTNTDRRRYFRIDDEVILGYRPYNPDQPAWASGEHAFLNTLREVDGELNTLINTLWQDNPTAARIAGLLNKKINAFVDKDGLLAEQQRALKTRHIEVNLSGSGIGFHCDEQFEPGQQLEVFLTLNPSNMMLPMIGNVINCIPVDERNSSYWVTLDYSDNNPKVIHEQLISHIVQRQNTQIGMKNNLLED